MAKREQITSRKGLLSARQRQWVERRLRGRGGARGGGEKPAPRPAGVPVPLSFGQQRIWFAERLEQGNAAYNISLGIRVAGRLNASAFVQGLREIARRHEILRTRFATGAGQPCQVVDPAGRLRVMSADLRGAADAGAVARMLAQRPFDLAEGPLWRVCIARLSQREHTIFFTMHHIICDAWSHATFIRELAALYKAFAAGRPSPLPELALQYGDFAYYQRRRLRAETLDGQLAYWRGQLEGAPPVLNMPTDRPRPPVATHNGAKRAVELPAPLGAALRRQCLAMGVTPYMFLLAAFQTLLHRCAGQNDIVVGAAVSNRRHTAFEGLIGFFVNTLALRADFAGDPNFAELLAATRQTVLDGLEHQDIPFERVVEGVNPQRERSYSPLFQALFVLQNAQDQALAMEGLSMEPLQVDSGASKFDLGLEMVDYGSDFRGTLVYNTDLFDAETIDRLVGQFGVLLAGAVAAPDGRVSELPLLDQDGRRRALEEWNDTGKTRRGPECVHQRFSVQARETPDAVAAVHMGAHLTYAELDARADRLAARLRDLGIGPEAVVGIYMERSLEMVTGVLGVLKAGGAYLPMDTGHPPERLAFMLADSRAQCVLTRGDLADGLPAYEGAIVRLDVADDVGGGDIRCLSRPGDLAYIIYTSGSTGKPKGVQVEHRQICNYVSAIEDLIGDAAGGHMAMMQPLAVDSSKTVLFTSLCNGGCLHLLPREYAIDPRLADDYFRRHRIDCLKIAPSHLAALHGSLGAARPMPRKWLIIGGEASYWAWVGPLQEATDCEIVNHYGPTEATVGALACHLGPSREGTPSGAVPVGSPLANVRAYLLDPHLQPVPIGVDGELHLGGDCVARGYLGKPAATAASFTPDPFSRRPGDRLYRTGDLCRYLPNGNIEFVGRADRQVKIRGFRIELGEVEAALSDHADVAEVAVALCGREGEDKRLAAYAVVPENRATTAAELQRFLGERLPRHMVPDSVTLVEELPRTSHGKVDAQALAALAGDPPQESGRPAAGPGGRGPRSAAELQLVRIWEELLAVRPIGVADDFFRLGGHSFLAIRLVDRIREDFGHELPLSALFANSTIEGLAGFLADGEQAGAGAGQAGPVLTAIQRTGDNAPFFCVAPLGGVLPSYANQCFLNLAYRLGAGQPFYAIQPAAGRARDGSRYTVERMAAEALDGLRRMRPAGPVWVGGWCNGGIVAFEMASQLWRAGGEVRGVVLLDSAPPDYPDRSEYDPVYGALDPETRLIARFVSELVPGALAAGSVSAHGDFLRMGEDQRWDYVMDLIKDAESVPDYATPDMVRRMFGMFRQGAEAGREIFASYVPRQLPIPITLLRAAGAEAGTPDPREGWQRLTGQALRSRTVDGGHFTMLKEPHVGELALLLGEELAS